MLDHLKRLSHPVDPEGKAWGIAVYCEPVATPRGVEWREVGAHQTGLEGVACVDDAARAAVLALRLAERDGDDDALLWARRWLEFVLLLRQPDGTFANFIQDWEGRPNLDGDTSRPGGEWWTARALWALGSGFRVIGEQRYAEAFLSGLPRQPTGKADIDAVLLLAVSEYLRRDPDPELCRLVRALANEVARCHDVYLRHHPGESELHLWGYEQVNALMAAAQVLSSGDYDRVCMETAQTILRELVEHGWYAVYPGTRDGQCAYSVAPVVRGLAALYWRTRDPRYREMALRASQWFYGRNSAGKSLYNPSSGRCYDYLGGALVKRTAGAESAIEAGLAEIERRRLAA